ncbi:hypothetical protein ACFYXM_22680 [Streptomyces sp. NPDC002476]|uniref:hypothetical protein n=1 Tax=Streptomyces sp. NPDC002476 TaxID=3364648 RepID=UPI0036A34693
MSTMPADSRGSPRRTAPHHTHTSSNPSTTRVPSVAASSSGPTHDGPSAAAPVTDRYRDAEAPPVTSTGPAVPHPPGASHVTPSAPTPRTAQASNGRAPLPAPFRALPRAPRRSSFPLNV